MADFGSYVRKTPHGVVVRAFPLAGPSDQHVPAREAVCDSEDCDTRLSRYNPTNTCGVCEGRKQREAFFVAVSA